MKRNGDHFGVGIISGSIWGSFQGWGSFRGLYSTAKERRLNQFGTAALIRCGRNVKVDRVCHIIRHWSRMRFIRRSSQVPEPNAYMHTLNLQFFPQCRSFLRSCHAQNTKLRKKAGEKGQSCSSCFEKAKYTCSVFENDERSNCQAAGKHLAGTS